MKTLRRVIGAVAIVLAVSSAPAAAQQSGEPPVRKTAVAEPLPRRGFSVVLLVGEMTGPGYPNPIPAAAMKAVSDMRDFLPYKGYSLLDTQWIVGGTSSPAVTRLRGLDGQDYEMELRVAPLLRQGTAAVDPQAMSVRFVLRDTETAGGGAEGGRTPLHPKEVAKGDTATQEMAREIFQLERERADLEIVAERGRRQAEVGIKDFEDVKRADAQLYAVNKRLRELKQAAADTAKSAGRTVIDTSFRMDDGETVVVGTSKMKGGSRALIAVVTATTDRARSSSK